jgi:hypothetical protein
VRASESQRDSILQPRVAKLPWVNIQRASSTLKGLYNSFFNILMVNCEPLSKHHEIETDEHCIWDGSNPFRVVSFGMMTQGSRFAPTLG